jgi:hypothetical protein
VDARGRNPGDFDEIASAEMDAILLAADGVDFRLFFGVGFQSGVFERLLVCIHVIPLKEFFLCLLLWKIT